MHVKKGPVDLFEYEVLPRMKTGSIYKAICMVIIAVCIAVRFALNPDTSGPLWLVCVFETVCLILLIKYILEIFRK